MSLSQSSLATRIKTEITNKCGNPMDAAKLDKMAQAIAKAVIDEIQANAVVNRGTFTAPNGGGAISGTGTIS